MKKLTASILSAALMLSMVFSSSVFAANDATTATSALDSFLGLFSKTATAAPGVEYRGHVQDYGNTPTDGSWIQGDNQLGTTGESKRIEGFWIELTNKDALPEGTQIRYNVHIENEGWQNNPDNLTDTSNWVKDGNFAGSTGKSQRVEAIEIILTDKDGVQLKDYSVQYIVHIENLGWSQGWVSDGALAGTAGKALRLEAIRIKVVQKTADLTAYNTALAAVKQADYTTSSWTTYQAVVDANKVTSTSTQTAVDTATANITAAQAKLVKLADMTAYNAAVEKAKAVDEAKYTADSYAALQKALTDNAVTADNTQAEVDAATAAINKSYDALEAVLYVESIQAIDLKQVKVVFNKEITPASVAPTDFQIDGATFTGTAVVESDNKTVILTLNTLQEQGTKSTVTVKDNSVTLKADSSIMKKGASVEVTFSDTVAPTVKRLEVTGNSTVDVYFSEAVYSAGVLGAADPANYKVDGVGISTLGGSITVDTLYDGGFYTNHVTLGFSTPLTEGTHSLQVIGDATDTITDYSNFKLAAVTTSFTVNGSVAAPTVSSITANTSGTVKVTFSEKMDLASLTSAFDIVGTGSGFSATLDTTKKVATLTSVPALTEGAQVLKIASTVKDIYGTQMSTSSDPVTVAFTATKDVTAPTVVSVYATAENVVRVEFSEPVDTAYLQNANFVLKDSEGTIQVGGTDLVKAWTSITPDPARADVVMLTIPTAIGKTLGQATYSLTIKNVSDITGNPIVETTKSFQTIDNTAPTLIAAPEFTVDTVNNTATVYFDEAINATTLTTKGNFYYGTTGDYKVVPSTVTLTPAANGKSVAIKFPSTISLSSWVSTVNQLQIVNIKDIAGNVAAGALTTTAFTSPSLVNNPDYVADSAVITADATKVTVKFSVDQVLTTVARADFGYSASVIGNGGVTPDSATVSGKVVTLTWLKSSNLATYNALKADGKNVVISANGTTYAGTKNASGAALIITGTTNKAVTDQIAPEKISTNAVDIVKVDEALNTVTIRFNEALKDVPALYADDFTLIKGGVTITQSNITASLANSNHDVVLTIGGSGIAAGDSIIVKFKATTDLKDVAGNAYVVTSNDTAGYTVAAVNTGVTGSMAITQTGLAPTAGTAQVETLSIPAGTAQYSANITVTVTATGMTGSSEAVAVAVAAGDDASAIAGKVRTALAANANVNGFFTIGGTAADVVLTAKTAAANDTTMSAALNGLVATGITDDATSTHTTAGIAPVVGQPQIETATVTTGAVTKAGNITVKVTADGMTNTPKDVTVAVANGNTQAEVAGRIRTALAADANVSAFFDIGGTGADVVLTAKTAAADDGTMAIAVTDTDTTGVVVGASADTQEGIAPSAGTKQVETATVAGTVTTAGAIQVTVTASGMTTTTVNVPVSAADSATIVAQRIREAFAANATVNGFFTIAGSGADVALTAKTAAANDATMNIAINGSSQNVADATSANTTGGVAPTAGTAEVATFTVASAATSAGTMTATFTDGTVTVSKTISVLATDTQAQVATKLQAAFAGQVAGWNVTNLAATTVFTAATPAANNPAVTMTLVNGL